MRFSELCWKSIGHFSLALGALGNSAALGKITDLGDLVLILRAAGGKPLLVSRSHFAHRYIMTIPFKKISGVILYY